MELQYEKMTVQHRDLLAAFASHKTRYGNAAIVIEDLRKRLDAIEVEPWLCSRSRLRPLEST